MLQIFRERSGGLFIKILFGVLVASFALWGVGDVFRNYSNMRPIATVGGSSVSQEEFLHAYQRVINNFQVMSKGKISSEEIKKMKLYQRVLDDQIDAKIVKEAIHNLGLVATDNAVRIHIQSIPAFKNANNQFDKNKFDTLVANSGLTERGFIKEIRDSLLQQQLFGSLSSGVRLPLFYQEKIFQGLQQQRVFTVVSVPLAQMRVTETPTEAELEQIFKENQAEFTQPEYRKLSLLVIDPKVVRDSIQVDEAKVREEYETRKVNFVLPENRDVTQLIFASRETAEAASKALNDGKTIAEVAKQYKADIRKFEQATPDKFTADHSNVIFGLTAGNASQPADSVLGYVVFIVTKIVPEHVQGFETVKGQLADDLKNDQVNDQLYELKNKIEDALAGGAQFAEVAKEHNLQVQVIDMVDKNGLDASKKSALPAEYQSLLLDNVLTLPEGGDTNVLEAANGTSVVAHVDKVIPQTIPELNQIQDKVEASWKEIKQQEKAAEVAQKLVKEADSVAKLIEFAKQNGLTPKVLKPISRVDAQKQQKPLEGVSANMLRQGFVLEANKAAYGPTEDGFAVIMLQKVVPFDLAKEKDKMAALGDSLKNMLQQDVQASYIVHLRQHGKVSINEAVIETLVNHS
ncbi:peptidylprolyl isomerase [Candidatus Paracaedibacter symbiosus]|uniref:peptidylprolyl isomerase n=1 Tax=Candidatus Paracaedibacter symbiosus TaxID=244582 RepID=UPI000509EACE|nr:peptidylprolyl isomerase [Candidatus Paracaedibacter symbiosus]